MSVIIDGRHLTCRDLHRIAHGEGVKLGQDVWEKMDANVKSMPLGPSILEEKRHSKFFKAGATETVVKPNGNHCLQQFCKLLETKNRKAQTCHED